MYYRYNRGESISGELNDIVATIIPLYNNEKEYFWIYSARVVLKGTIYAMFEDKNIDDNTFNLDTIKNILQNAFTESSPTFSCKYSEYINTTHNITPLLYFVKCQQKKIRDFLL